MRAELQASRGRSLGTGGGRVMNGGVWERDAGVRREARCERVDVIDVGTHLDTFSMSRCQPEKDELLYGMSRAEGPLV